MSLKPLELAQVAEELDRGLSGAFIQKAYAPLPRRCYLELRQVGRSTLLLLSAEPEVARLSVAARRMTSDNPQGFQRWIRQELIGAQLSSVRAEGENVHLTFRRGEEQRELLLDVHGHALTLLAGEHLLAASPHSGQKKEPRTAPKSTQKGVLSRLVPVEGQPFPWAAGAEALYADRERARQISEARRQLISPLKARRARLLRTLDKVAEEADRTEQAQSHRRWGELLSHSLHQIPRGEHSVRLTEYSEEGVREVDVPLDPKLPPKEQSARHFHLYRRLLRGAEHARRRFEQLSTELKEVEGGLERAEQMSEQELLEPGLLQRVPHLAQPRGPARHQAYRTYLSKDGSRILVGKSSQDNDTLTFKIARPFDLWLHARGVPGSHVVVPLQREQELSQEALLDAAHLAIRYSPLKGEPVAEVAYTPARFVRKVKAGAPGQVLYTREKVIRLRMEPARLERLLRADESFAPAEGGLRSP